MKSSPLVEPRRELSADELQRYARHISLAEIGLVGQRRLAAARVLVIGAGGLGSPALTYLAAAGIGTLGVIDDDVVEASNLHRQVIHGRSDVGRPKVDSARDAIAEINPHVEVITHRERLTRDNALTLFADYDLIVDGADNFATRYLVNDAATLTGRPYVWGSILRFAGQVSVFWAGHGPTYRDLFPDPPAPGTVPSCAEAGVLGVLCAAIGAAMGTEAVKLITGAGQSLLGRVLIHDALAMTWDTLELRPDPDRVEITELTDYDLMCGVTMEPTTPEPAADEISVRQLQQWLAEREAGRRDFVLVDVREPYEREINDIAGAVGIPVGRFAEGTALAELPGDTPLVLYCKRGVRSAQCLAAVQVAGRTDAVHVAGGIDAWVDEIEPEQRSY